MPREMSRRHADELCRPGQVSGSEPGNWSVASDGQYRYDVEGCRLARPTAISQFKAAVGAVGRPDGRVRVEDGVEACVVAARVVRGVDRLRDCQCDEVSAKWACLLGLRPACLNQR